MKQSPFKFIFSILAIGVVSILWNFVGVTPAVFCLIFFCWVLFGLDQNILAATVVLLLIAVAIFLSLGNDAFAKNIAVYVYYLLGMIALLRVVGLRGQGREEKKMNVPRMIRFSNTSVKVRKKVIDIRKLQRHRVVIPDIP